MRKKLNLAEILEKKTEENQTRKILEIMKESEDLQDAIKKVKALLDK